MRTSLPAVKGDGVVLRVDTGVTNDAQPITATVRNSGEKRKLLTAAFLLTLTRWLIVAVVLAFFAWLVLLRRGRSALPAENPEID